MVSIEYNKTKTGKIFLEIEKNFPSKLFLKNHAQRIKKMGNYSKNDRTA